MACNSPPSQISIAQLQAMADPLLYDKYVTTKNTLKQIETELSATHCNLVKVQSDHKVLGAKYADAEQCLRKYEAKAEYTAALIAAEERLSAANAAICVADLEEQVEYAASSASMSQLWQDIIRIRHATMHSATTCEHAQNALRENIFQHVACKAKHVPEAIQKLHRDATIKHSSHIKGSIMQLRDTMSGELEAAKQMSAAQATALHLATQQCNDEKLRCLELQDEISAMEQNCESMGQRCAESAQQIEDMSKEYSTLKSSYTSILAQLEELKLERRDIVTGQKPESDGEAIKSTAGPQCELSISVPASVPLPSSPPIVVTGHARALKRLRRVAIEPTEEDGKVLADSAEGVANTVAATHETDTAVPKPDAKPKAKRARRSKPAEKAETSAEVVPQNENDAPAEGMSTAVPAAKSPAETAAPKKRAPRKPKAKSATVGVIPSEASFTGAGESGGDAMQPQSAIAVAPSAPLPFAAFQAFQAPPFFFYQQPVLPFPTAVSAATACGTQIEPTMGAQPPAAPSAVLSEATHSSAVSRLSKFKIPKLKQN